MEKPWTLDDCQLNEDQVHIIMEVIFEALEDSEYFDWLDNADAEAFSPATAALVERAMKDAYKERRLAALAAFRTLLRINDRAINEVRWHLEEE